MVAGFDHLQLSLIDYTTPYKMGNVPTTEVTANLISKPYVISPNPVSDRLHITAEDSDYSWEICNINGSKVLKGQSESKSANLNVAGLKPGLYLLNTRNLRTNLLTSTRFIKK